MSIQALDPENYEQVLAENAAMRSLIRRFAKFDPLFVTSHGMVCMYHCAGQVTGGDEGTQHYEHALECPWALMQAIISTEQEVR